jgi:glucosamine--fructose-6-phosphate aminotransferase (isomerizing)
MHGPWELMETGFPVLVYSPADAAHETTREAVEKMRRAGADVRVVEHAATGHPLLDPLAMIQSAYLEIERLAIALGRDPDRPRLLKKVTETL